MSFWSTVEFAFAIEVFSTFGKYVDEKCEETKRLPPKPDHELSVMEQLMKIDKDLAFAMTFDMFMAGVDTVRNQQQVYNRRLNHNIFRLLHHR